MKTTPQELVDEINRATKEVLELRNKVKENSETAKLLQSRLDVAIEERDGLRFGFTRQQARAEAFEEIVDRLLGKKHQPAKDDSTFTAVHRRNPWE